MNRLFRLFALFGLLILFGCKKDPDTLPEKLMLYTALCPSGIRACYTQCGSRWDTNKNGTIDPAELIDFNSCTGICDVHCDTSFLYLLFQK